MACKSIVEQLSEAMTKQQVNNSDQLAVVDNATLYNVTVGDFIVAMGLTGSIDNEGAGTQLLTGTAPDYKIKTIAGGDGLSIQSNTQGGLTLNTKIGNAGTTASGERIVANLTGSQLNMKRIKAGRGISVRADANSVIIDNEQSAGTGRTVPITQLSDFPPAVGGVIALADDTDYLILTSITTANRFTMGSNTVLRNSDARTSLLTYTGTGTMFTMGNGSQVIKDVSLACPNGKMFDANNSTGSFVLRWVRITDVKDVGEFGKTLTGIYNVLIENITGNVGFRFGGQSDIRLTTEQFIVLNATDPTLNLFDLDGATFSSFNLSIIEVLQTVAGQSFIKGIAGGANMAGQTIGFIGKVTIQGDMDMLDTITSDDVGYDFTDCNKLLDTDPHGMVYLSAPATTTITAASTPVIVNGVFTEQGVKLFDSTAAGRLIYKGKRENHRNITASISLEPSSGSNKDLNVLLFKNGVEITAATIGRQTSSGTGATITLVWADDLQTDDYYEIYVSNETDTINILVSRLIFRIS